MWNYEKRLQYPVHIKTPNAKIAKIILTQYGGPYISNIEYFFLPIIYSTYFLQLLYKFFCFIKKIPIFPIDYWTPIWYYIITERE